MGKTKELFMQHRVNEDYERQFLLDRIIVDAWQEEEYDRLKSSDEMNKPLTTKIIVSNERISEIDQEKSQDSQQAEVFELGF